MTPERLSEITRAAQAEAEREYPTQETTDPRDIELFHALNLERLALRAAHLKCAVAYAIRAEGLVEAGNKMDAAIVKCENEMNRHDIGSDLMGETLYVRLEWESALTTYTNTNS